LDRRAGLLSLSPVKDKFFGLQDIQQFFCHSLDRLLFLAEQLNVWTGQDVKYGKFLFCEVFRDAALIFLVQVFGKGDQLSKEGVDVFGAAVIFRDQLLLLYFLPQTFSRETL
jgi:hypothetical protein